MLGKPEVDSALADLGELGINCDFCGKHYTFDKVDCAQLFAAPIAVDSMVQASAVKH
jgi:molecular chaperone Hsp33